MSEFASLEELAEQPKLGVKEETFLDPVEEIQQPNPVFQKIGSILTMETGEGSIEDYIDHPLNYKKNKGMAQVLRGLTGIVGNLKLAIIDIGLGVLNMRGANNNDRVLTDYKGNGMV